ncbi:hypothetical protein Pfo_005722 [Paulownia fortunei]|nr:hypothetical protein Pfo_005722 [Paulownia fortunei]
MGLFMSFMGKGLPTTQMLSLVMGILHRQFIEKDIKSFEEFDLAILNIFSTVNAALPGKNYDACFNKWKAVNESENKEFFIEFMKKVNLSQLDDSTLMTGIATPPAAMAAKRAGETVPQLKLILISFLCSWPRRCLLFPSDYTGRCFLVTSHHEFTSIMQNLMQNSRTKL